jgi:hypothetical protein
MIDEIKPLYETVLFSSPGELEKLDVSYRVYPLKATELVLACKGAKLVIELGEMMPETRLELAEYSVYVVGVVLHPHCMEVSVSVNVINRLPVHEVRLTFELGKSGIGEVWLNNELKGNYPFYQFIEA